MSYHVTHSTGQMERDYPKEKFGHLLDELFSVDAEHPDVSVSHESEWSLTVNRSGVLILENLEEGEPMHTGPLQRDAVVGMMVAVAEGRLQEVLSRHWLPGYPPKPPA